MGLLKNNKKLNEIDKENYQQRIQTIEDEIFISVYHKIENSLMTEDKLLVALKFVQLRLGLKYDEDFKLMMESPTIIETTWNGILDNNLSLR